MEHVYKSIFGWFDFEDLYDYVIQQVDNNAHLVEVGVFLGKSLSYLLVESLNSGKNIKVDGVDDFSLITHEYYTQSLKKEFWQNMKYFQLEGLINNFFELSSEETIQKFENESLDFVFLDYTLDGELLINEVPFWIDKLKPGGFIGGHDWKYLEYYISQYFDRGKIALKGNVANPCWLVRK